MNNWSYSRYGTWKKCPAILRFQAECPPAPSHPAAQRGTDLHKIIEDYLLGTGKLTDELSYYRPFLDTLREFGCEPELEIAIDQQWNLLPFDDPNRWWRGIVDCLVENEEDKEIIIFDWKTGQEYGDHRDQREIYAAVIPAHIPDDWWDRVKCIHVYLDKKLNTVSEYPRDSIEKIRREWEKKVEPMLTDDKLLPNPGFYCRSCHFRRDNGGPCIF